MNFLELVGGPVGIAAWCAAAALGAAVQILTHRHRHTHHHHPHHRRPR